MARPTLAEWFGRIGMAPQSLDERLAELLRKRDYLPADETSVQQLDPGTGKRQHAYWWGIPIRRMGARATDLRPRLPVKSGRRPCPRFHAIRRGHLLVDDYSGYRALFKQSPIELLAWPISRAVFDLHAATGSPVAIDALGRVLLLYTAEQQAADMKHDKRLTMRQQHPVPAPIGMCTWLLPTQRTVAVRSGAVKAIEHAHER